MSKFLLAGVALAVVLVAFAAPGCGASQMPSPLPQNLQATEERIVEALGAPEQEESYQRVYEAFTKLVSNVTNNSLGNVRRLVTRLNRLVGTRPTPEQQSVQSIENRTEQILNRLDRVDQTTDQHTLSQLNEDVSRLVGTLNQSYLRNIRRVLERVNRVVGRPSASGIVQASPSMPIQSMNRQFQSTGDRVDDPLMKQPGFPGFDEFLLAMDRVQKSLAHFVRSSTRFITSG